MVIPEIGPKYPFSPRDLYNLQRKTDTLTGREYTKRIEVPSALNAASTNSVIKNRRREREQMKEYAWKLEDDDDNLRDDVLAPRYSSF